MTLVDLYRKVLEKLEVVAAGESAAAEDTQFIASKYVTVWNLLKVNGLISWAVDEAVPNEAVEPIVACLAYASASEFGEEEDRFAAAGAIGLPTPSLAERQLRVLHTKRYVSAPVRTQYF